ncbi:hypothetical protein CDFC105_03947 [Clostridioides difficile]|nr:hypothetical protein CDFC105_03947 [Clostridioides difficile]
MVGGEGGWCRVFFFFQAEDGIRDFCLSRGLGDVYKRQVLELLREIEKGTLIGRVVASRTEGIAGLYPEKVKSVSYTHLTLPTIYSV